MEFSFQIDQLNSPDFYGFFAALLTTCAFVPQVVKTWNTHSANDVSFTMLLMFILGVLFWIVYAWETNSLPVLLANVVTLILNLAILSLKLFYLQTKEPIE